MTTLIYSIILVLIILIAATTIIAGKSFAPWVPCRDRDLRRIFKLANLKPEEVFYDLGCGNGKTVVFAAKNYGAKAVGIELAFPLFIASKLRELVNGNKNIKFKWKNLFDEDISKADVIYFFGMPKTIKNKLKEKIEKEAKPGARIVSYVFKVEGWEPQIIDKPNANDLPVYLYRR
ncbi:MAG: hypothetical protein V1770_04035 [bacterium]